MLPPCRKTPVHAHVALDRDHVVVDEESFADGPVVLVPVHDILEVRRGMAAGVAVSPILTASKWSSVRRQIALARRVPTVALISNDQVERVDGNIELSASSSSSHHPVPNAAAPKRLMVIR